MRRLLLYLSGNLLRSGLHRYLRFARGLANRKSRLLNVVVGSIRPDVAHIRPDVAHWNMNPIQEHEEVHD